MGMVGGFPCAPTKPLAALRIGVPRLVVGVWLFDGVR
jgi:hypothetical protein